MTAARVYLAAVSLGLAFALFYQLGVPLRASHSAQVTGDEPFYLLTTVSLLSDGDLDLANDYALRRYRAFFDHPQELWYQSVPTKRGQILSPHNLGTSLLVLPAYALGGLDGAKAFLAALGGLTVALTFLLAFRVTGQLVSSACAAALIAVSAPTFVYASQVYPEGPAALAVASTALLATARRPSWGTSVLLAITMTAMLWLGVKYAFVGSVLTLVALARLPRWPRLLGVGLLMASTIGYAWFHLATYGGLTPYAVNQFYAGSTTVELAARHLELWNRLYRFIGLWVDGEFGLVRWAPALALVVAGLPLLVRRAGPSRWLLAAVGMQMLVAVFLSISMRGWWFPGRMLIPALPLLVLPLAEFLALARRRPGLGAVAAVLGLYGLGITLSLRDAVLAESVVLAVDPFSLPWAPFAAVSGAFPVYTSYEPATWALTAGWLAVALGLLSLGRTIADAHSSAAEGPSIPEAER